MAAPSLKSPIIKMIVLSLLSLLLLIPLADVNGLIHERQNRAHEAEASIASQWGGSQVLAGAYLHGEVEQSYEKDGKTLVRLADAVLLPDRLDIESSLVPEVRKRGIFVLPVYSSKVKIAAHFEPEQLRAFQRSIVSERPLQFRLAVSDARGLRALADVQVNDAKYRLSAMRRGIADLSSLGAEVPRALLNAAGGIDVDLDLEIAGARSVSWLPLGRTTRVHLAAPWRDPSFDGAFLPTQREITAQGFDARWQVLEFNRTYPQSFNLDAVPLSELFGSAFGLSLFQPAGLYQQNERSGKYGMLMIALVFTGLFLFEALLKLSLHPIQYGLVGLTLATFYVLLLALSEHVGYDMAYAIAASAAVLLVGFYARSVLGSLSRACMLAALQASAYGVFFVLVKSEDYALLLGASALFVVLGLIMYLTRRTDWSNLGKNDVGAPSGATAN